MTLKQFYAWQTFGGAKDVSRLVAALEEREISRMLEAHPYIAGLIPPEIYDKLEK